MKNLKTRGSQIKSSKVEMTTEIFNGNNIDVVHLTVETDRVYKFRVCSDERHPDLEKTKIKLDKELKDNIGNFNNFEVSNYAERNYLFINGSQYTGKQLV